MKIRHLWGVLMIAGLAGCSAHSPLIIKNTLDVERVSSKTYPPHNKRVYVTTASLPEAVKCEVLGNVDIGKIWYGSTDDLMKPLADGARKLGADAVVEVKSWHQPSGWSMAAPHASGKAVKFVEPASVDFSALGGEWQ